MKRLQYDDEICDDYPIVIPAKRSVQCRKITDAVYWYYSLLYHVKQISDYGGRSSLALRMTQRTSRKKLFVVISRKDEGFLIEKFEVS